jgi:hypothetical protein
MALEICALILNLKELKLAASLWVKRTLSLHRDFLFKLSCKKKNNSSVLQIKIISLHLWIDRNATSTLAGKSKIWDLKWSSTSANFMRDICTCWKENEISMNWIVLGRMFQETNHIVPLQTDTSRYEEARRPHSPKTQLTSRSIINMHWWKALLNPNNPHKSLKRILCLLENLTGSI